MLKILVCVKQVPDVNLVKIDPETGSLIRQGVPSILNPLDCNALEAAVQLKEKYGGEITCITMGPDMAEEALRECLAAGGDNAVLLSDRAFANADTLATSYVLRTAAKALGDFDLIFCGKESLDGATGQMAAQLAERFEANQVSSVSLIKELNTEDKYVIADREMEGGIQTVKAQYPCLFTIEKTNYTPRIPNLKNWKKSRTLEITRLNSKTIEGLETDKIGDPGSPTKVPRTYPPETGKIGHMLSSVEELVEVLYE